MSSGGGADKSFMFACDHTKDWKVSQVFPIAFHYAKVAVLVKEKLAHAARDGFPGWPTEYK